MSTALRVLVVDDERLSRDTTGRQLRDSGFIAETAENGFIALERLRAGDFDVVLTDLRMPGLDGLELLARVREQHAAVDVILMTAYGTVESAVKAMQGGATDFLTKPFHFQELEHRLRKLGELRAYRQEVENLRALVGSDDLGIIGRSPGMLDVAQRIRTFAAHDAPVLVTGETGTGKELVARALHLKSRRAKAPFVAVPCGAIPAELAESELFGHERGSFTGATAQRKGTFERADGGTLLLDDVDDLPLVLQAKLLRALQEGTFTRVGGGEERRVDVRVVATTKIELADAVRSGRFRDDLFYRLRGLEIRLPPLRGRGDDLLLLAQHFLRRFSGTEQVLLSPELVGCLRHYPWPGNVRELARSLEAALALAAGGEVRCEHLPESVRAGGEEGARPVVALALDGRESIPFAEVIREVEDRLIQWALERAGGQQSRAAELLGLARTTLQSKLGRGDR